MVTVGDIIYMYRDEHHMSQRHFALLCGLSNGYVAMIERNYNPKTGKPIVIGIDNLRAIANAMGMTADQLMRMVDGDTPVSLKPSDDVSAESADDARTNARRITELYGRLSPDNRIRLETYLEALIDTQQKPEA